MTRPIKRVIDATAYKREPVLAFKRFAVGPDLLGQPFQPSLEIGIELGAVIERIQFALSRFTKCIPEKAELGFEMPT